MNQGMAARNGVHIPAQRWSKSLAHELGRFTIMINCIGPCGVINTMLEQIHANEKISQI
jgi:hypothetical protein